jgi:hypothetical protein
MLALCYAAAHPNKAGPIVLVGCGTFDHASRARMKEILRDRTDLHLQERLAEVTASTSDAADLRKRPTFHTKAGISGAGSLRAQPMAGAFCPDRILFDPENLALGNKQRPHCKNNREVRLVFVFQRNTAASTFR